MESLLDDDFPETATRSLLVAVKTLNNDASQQARCVRGEGGGWGVGGTQSLLVAVKTLNSNTSQQARYVRGEGGRGEVGWGGGHTITSSRRQDTEQQRQSTS